MPDADAKRDRGLGRFGVSGLTLGLDATSDVATVARIIEGLGYSCIWVPEWIGREPFVAASQMLSATSDLRVGTAVATIYSRSPLALAMAERTLNLDHPGRFVLGLGVSHPAQVAELHGREFDPPVRTMARYLEQMAEAARKLALPEASTGTRVLAANGPRMQQLAATACDGVLPVSAPTEFTSAVRDAIGPDKLLIAQRRVVLTADPSQARSVARAFLAGMLALPTYQRHLRRCGFEDADLADGGSNRLVDATVSWGTNQRIARELDDLLGAGADHVIVGPLGGRPIDRLSDLASAINARP